MYNRPEREQDDCDYEASQVRFERCLDSCGLGFDDQNADWRVSCSAC